MKKNSNIPCPVRDCWAGGVCAVKEWVILEDLPEEASTKYGLKGKSIRLRAGSPDTSYSLARQEEEQWQAEERPVWHNLQGPVSASDC